MAKTKTYKDNEVVGGRKKKRLSLSERTLKNLSVVNIIVVIFLAIALIWMVLAHIFNKGTSNSQQKFFEKEIFYYLNTGDLKITDGSKLLTKIVDFFKTTTVGVEKSKIENSLNELNLTEKSDEQKNHHYLFYFTEEGLFTFDAHLESLPPETEEIRIKIMDGSDPKSPWGVYFLLKEANDEAGGVEYSLKYINGKFDVYTQEPDSYRHLNVNTSGRNLEDVIENLIEGIGEALKENPNNAARSGRNLEVQLFLFENGNVAKKIGDTFLLQSYPRKSNGPSYTLPNESVAEVRENVLILLNKLFSAPPQEKKWHVKIFKDRWKLTENEKNGIAGEIYTDILQSPTDTASFEMWEKLFEARKGKIIQVDNYVDMKPSGAPDPNFQTFPKLAVWNFIGIIIFTVFGLWLREMKKCAKKKREEELEQIEAKRNIEEAKRTREETERKKKEEEALERKEAEGMTKNRGSGTILVTQEKKETLKKIKENLRLIIEDEEKNEGHDQKMIVKLEITEGLVDDLLKLEIVPREFWNDNVSRMIAKFSEYKEQNPRANQLQTLEYTRYELENLKDEYKPTKEELDNKGQGISDETTGKTGIETSENGTWDELSESTYGKHSRIDKKEHYIFKIIYKVLPFMQRVRRKLFIGKSKQESEKFIVDTINAPLENKKGILCNESLITKNAASIEECAELTRKNEGLINDNLNLSKNNLNKINELFRKVNSEMRYENNVFQALQFINRMTDYTVNQNNITNLSAKLYSEPKISYEYRHCAIELHANLLKLQDFYEDQWFWALIKENFFDRLDSSIHLFKVNGENGKTIYDSILEKNIPLKDIEDKHIKKILLLGQWSKLWDGVIRISDFFNAYFEHDMDDIKFVLGHYAEVIKGIISRLGYSIHGNRPLEIISADYMKDCQASEKSYVTKVIMKNLMDSENKRFEDAMVKTPEGTELIIFVNRLGLSDNTKNSEKMFAKLSFASYSRGSLLAHFSTKPGLRNKDPEEGNIDKLFKTN